MNYDARNRQDLGWPHEMCCGFDVEQAMPHSRKNFMPFGVGDVWAQRLLSAADFDHSALAGGVASANSTGADSTRTSSQSERQVMTWIKIGEDVYDVFRYSLLIALLLHSLCV
jgi:hypothetical protein